ncbi:hypothetical protein GCM10023185_37250 [Hymenobacter saemangeumensis]|uniref:Uncharacterized protein n=1 Tax=Hymenobacter saemangeumensis TaxID=1084522 RepID=A0ABP8IQT1_9BACT
MPHAADDATYNQVIELNELYNELARLQQKLPGSKPKHNNYADQEQAVRNKAQEIIYFALGIRSAGTDLHSQVDSITEGCVQTRANPYKKLAHEVKIPPRR